MFLTSVPHSWGCRLRTPFVVEPQYLKWFFKGFKVLTLWFTVSELVFLDWQILKGIREQTGCRCSPQPLVLELILVICLRLTINYVCNCHHFLTFALQPQWEVFIVVETKTQARLFFSESQPQHDLLKKADTVWGGWKKSAINTLGRSLGRKEKIRHWKFCFQVLLQKSCCKTKWHLVAVFSQLLKEIPEVEDKTNFF